MLLGLVIAGVALPSAASADSVTTTIPVGGNLFDFVVTPDGQRAYSVDFATGAVSVIELGDASVIATIRGPSSGDPAGAGIAISPDGTRVYALYGSPTRVAVIDTATNAVIDTIAGGNSYLMSAMTISPDGSRLVLITLQGFIQSVDTATGTASAAVKIASGHIFTDGAISSDGTRLYLTAWNQARISVVDLTTESLVTSVDLAPAPCRKALC